MSISEIQRRWFEQVEISTFSDFEHRLVERREKIEAELKDKAGRGELAVNLEGDPYVTLATGLDVKVLPGNRYQAREAGGDWKSFHPGRANLPSDMGKRLRELSGLMGQLRSIRKDGEDLAVALNELEGKYQSKKGALRQADRPQMAETAREELRAFQEANRDVLPLCVENEISIEEVNALGRGLFCPAPPSGVKATSGDSAGIQLTWNPCAGAHEYLVFSAALGCKAKDLLSVVDGGTTSFFHTDAEPEQDLQYWVSAKNAAGESGCSEPPARGKRKKGTVSPPNPPAPSNPSTIEKRTAGEAAKAGDVLKVIEICSVNGTPDGVETLVERYLESAFKNCLEKLRKNSKPDEVPVEIGKIHKALLDFSEQGFVGKVEARITRLLNEIARVLDDRLKKRKEREFEKLAEEAARAGDVLRIIELCRENATPSGVETLVDRHLESAFTNLVERLDRIPVPNATPVEIAKIERALEELSKQEFARRFSGRIAGYREHCVRVQIKLQEIGSTEEREKLAQILENAASEGDILKVIEICGKNSKLDGIESLVEGCLASAFDNCVARLQKDRDLEAALAEIKRIDGALLDLSGQVTAGRVRSRIAELRKNCGDIRSVLASKIRKKRAPTRPRGRRIALLILLLVLATIFGLFPKEVGYGLWTTWDKTKREIVRILKNRQMPVYSAIEKPKVRPLLSAGFPVSGDDWYSYKLWGTEPSNDLQSISFSGKTWFQIAAVVRMEIPLDSGAPSFIEIKSLLKPGKDYVLELTSENSGIVTRRFTPPNGQYSSWTGPEIVFGRRELSVRIGIEPEWDQAFATEFNRPEVSATVPKAEDYSSTKEYKLLSDRQVLVHYRFELQGYDPLEFDVQFGEKTNRIPGLRFGPR